MSDLLTEFFAQLLGEDSKKSLPAGMPTGLTAGRYGKYYFDKEKKQYAGKVETGKWKPGSTAPGGTKSTKKSKTSTKNGKSSGKRVQGSKKSRSTPPQAAAVPMSDAPGKIPPKPITPAAAATDKEKYDELMTAMKKGKIKFDDNDHKTRVETFMKLWQAFVSAPSYEEQVKAVKVLIDQGMIEGGSSGKKIYISGNVGLPPKGMCGDRGTPVTKLMNQIIKDEGFDLPPREGSKASQQAAESGPTNEAGVAYLLDPSEENKNIYEEKKSRYSQSGGDLKEMDELNTSAADAVRGALPKGAKVTRAVQVGGSRQLQQQYGIDDPRIDPTDIVVEYTLGGKKYTMKISAKIYTNPRRITMKNAGLEDAGDTYLGQPEGSSADELFNKLRKNPKLDWTAPGLSEKQSTERKRQFRQTYLKGFASQMEKLAQNSDPRSKGQQRLLQMWKKVHGCGQDVHTLVIDKKSGGAELKSPDHYCNPKLPFKVRYNGTKVIIEMDSGGPQTLEINLKTESNGSTKLLFNHVVRKSKKAEE